MSLQALEEQITISGSLLTISIFEEKLMKNFMIINSKLRKLDGITEIQQKIRNLEKQHKFLNMKVETIVEKLPKDGGSINKNDVKIIAKEQIQQMLNNDDQKINKTKFKENIMKQILKVKEQLLSANLSYKANAAGSGSASQSRTSFTAGQALRETEKMQQQRKSVNKDSLEEVLNENEMQYVNDIFEQKQQQNKGNSPLQEINTKLKDLYNKIDELKMGKGYANFADRQKERFQKYEQYEEKSRQTARKQRQKGISLQGIKHENVKGEFLKNQLYSQYQRAQLIKEQLNKNENILQKKTVYGGFPKKAGQIRKDDPNKLQMLTDDQLKMRSKSFKRLQKLDRRLKVDDFKDLNTVLREIQLRIEGKVSHDIFMGLIKDFEQKLQIIKITKDSSNDINQLRKSLYVVDNKLQSMISYLQNSMGDDDAVFVKKQWTCVSCDKNIEKFQGKLGHHLNWQSFASKKISPTKIGAFGQTGQLASKIKNLMENQDEQQ